jgi:hypothetical protein
VRVLTFVFICCVLAFLYKLQLSGFALTMLYNHSLEHQCLLLAVLLLTILLQVLLLDFDWIVSLNSLIHGPGTRR